MQQSNPLSRRLFHGSERILVVFTIYGLTIGSIAVIAASLDLYILSPLFIALNYPAVILAFMFLGEGFSIPVPIPVWNLVIIFGSGAAWSGIGMIVYGFVKMFKLGP